jgi:glutamate 5-kinase
MSEEYRRIVVKIGSNILTRSDGTLDVTRMSSLTDQISALYQRGIEVIIVSSGAVASGRSELHTERKLDSVDQRQLFSAVGQAKLINRYYELFSDHHIVVGQVLTMKENFATRRHYLNQKNCMEVMLRNGVIPIVNENDTISVTELMFTDNDELSGLIASMMNVQALFILSNIDGIYDGSPSDALSHVIRTITPDMDLSQYIQTGKSSFGRGGMYTSYQNKMSRLSDAQKKVQEDAIVAKEKSAAELKRKYFGPDGELAKLRQNLIKPIQDQIYNAAKALSERYGYSIVIDRASASSIIFASPSIDISEDVLAKMGYSK